MMEWISVEDRMPEENVPVLVVSSDWPQYISAALWAYEDGWHWEEHDNTGFLNDPENYVWDDDYKFTHWMPFPNVPKSKNKEEA